MDSERSEYALLDAETNRVKVGQAVVILSLCFSSSTGVYATTYFVIEAYYLALCVALDESLSATKTVDKEVKSETRAQLVKVVDLMYDRFAPLRQGARNTLWLCLVWLFVAGSGELQVAADTWLPFGSICVLFVAAFNNRGKFGYGTFGQCGAPSCTKCGFCQECKFALSKYLEQFCSGFSLGTNEKKETGETQYSTYISVALLLVLAGFEIKRSHTAWLPMLASMELIRGCFTVGQLVLMFRNSYKPMMADFEAKDILKV